MNSDLSFMIKKIGYLKMVRLKKISTDISPKSIYNSFYWSLKIITSMIQQPILKTYQKIVWVQNSLDPTLYIQNINKSNVNGVKFQSILNRCKHL